MKKLFKVAGCLAMVLSLSGCTQEIYTRSATNVIDTKCDSCLKPTNIDTLVNNVEKVMKTVDAVHGSYEITNTKNTYKISFEAITKEKRVNWDGHAKLTFDDKKVDLYLKDTKFYLIYPNNGANVILKDNITSAVVEVEDTLTRLNATYDQENLENNLTGDKLEGFNFEKLKNLGTYVKNNDGTYTISVKENGLEWEYDITSTYLIVETRCKAINFTSTLSVSYPSSVSITYPMGLDFLTVNIKDVKKVLEIESFAELLDPSLKEENNSK